MKIWMILQKMAILNQTPIFLEDLDYLLYTLENNFGSFDVAYWMHGVDIHAVIEEIRSSVVANPDTTTAEFFNQLMFGLSPIRAGHFSVVHPITYHSIVNNRNNHAWFFFPESSLARLFYPHVVEFYEQHQPIVGTVATLTQTPYRMLRAYSDIIEEGRIAYLSIQGFLGDDYGTWMSTHKYIEAFYNKNRGFDHLIVDMRGYFGGSSTFFYDAIIRPNISHRHRVEGFAFFPYGTYISTHFEGRTTIFGMSLDPLTGFQTPDRLLRTTAEMLAGFDLPNIIMSDMERMEYAKMFRLDLYPRPLYGFDDIAFDGKIWLLTSPNMASARMLSAWVARDTGIATHVGETTGGQYGGPRIFIALPNTGILFQMDLFYITDRYGWPVEAGIAPHHFNREGMDALETTLALIAEGDY